MTFEEYEKDLRDLAREIGPDAKLEHVELRPSAREVIKRVRRERIPFEEAARGTPLHPQPPRPTEFARQQVKRGYGAAEAICGLLRHADSDLTESRVKQLEETLYGDWLQP